MGEIVFVAIGALTFALVGSIFLTFWFVVIGILVREVKRALRERRLKKARAQIRGRERMRIARMIEKKASEEEWLNFLARFDDIDPD